MGQESVLKLLESEKKWMSAREIAEKLEISLQPTFHAVAQLSKHKFIKVKAKKRENNRGRKTFLVYKAK